MYNRIIAMAAVTFILMGVTTVYAQNETDSETAGNATQTFDKLKNSTALLDEQIAAAEGGNATDRADLRAAIDESLKAMGETSVINATIEQLIEVGVAASSVSQAVDNAADTEEDNGE